MTNPKTVTDAALAAAALAWGKAWKSRMFGDSPMAEVQRAESDLYYLCLRAAREREEGDE